MDLIKIEELIEVLEGSRTEEISVRKGEFSVYIKKGPKKKPAKKAAVAKPAPAAVSAVHTEAASAADYVLAPMVGIFHSTGVLNVGETIKAGQVVGAIESMKLLNDVVSSLSGAVSEVLVEAGTPVEYGQPLYKVERA
jgi:acetyl-CoA carboxylase biotin carboxyl carrier protein